VRAAPIASSGSPATSTKGNESLEIWEIEIWEIEIWEIEIWEVEIWEIEIWEVEIWIDKCAFRIG
jgi:hypothetical protein